MTRTIALLAAGYLARCAQTTQWTWPLMQVQCRRMITDDTFGHKCSNTVWRIRWGRLAPRSIVCRSCQKAGEAEHGA